MSTYVSTDLPTEVAERLQAAFDAAQTTLRQREEDMFVWTLKQEEAQDAKIQSGWAEPLKVLKTCLPEWIHRYIEQPDRMYEEYRSFSDWGGPGGYEYAFVSIAVPGCQPIAAWVLPDASLCLEVMQPKVSSDEETGVWYVHDTLEDYRLSREDIRNKGENDIAVALFRAHDAYLRRLDLVAEAEERNAYVPETLIVPAPEPEPEPAPEVPDPIDQARQLVAMLSNDERIKITITDDYETDAADSRTLVLASVGLAIAYHVSRVADALEGNK